MTVERTCTELRHDESGLPTSSPKPLSAYESERAYVLLGDAGSGKTTVFKAECKRLGSKARFVSARDFRTYAGAGQSVIKQEFEGKTLFIDGLDEIRSRVSDIPDAVDQISSQLLCLGRPSFRVSCREADWRGEFDRQSLRLASAASTLTTLRLDPIAPQDIERILDAIPEVDDPRAFMDDAQQQGIDALLYNPQNLHMLAKAMHERSEWPTSRFETFQLACEQLAREVNGNRAYSRSERLRIETLMHCAGWLCAVQLISDQAGYSLDRIQARDGYTSLEEIANGDLSILRQAIATRLFKADHEQSFSPAHRQIAEFLAAKYLAGLIDEGFPARRVLALMAGSDGVVVTGLRGLSAWLAAHNKVVRHNLINSDPLGVALYGDIQSFSAEDKRMMLEVLVRQPHRLSNLAQSAGAFAPLATVSTQSQIRQILKDSVQSDRRRERVQFVMLVLGRSESLPDLANELLSIVRDDSRSHKTRELALRAYICACKYQPEFIDTLEGILEEITQVGISQSTSEMCGILLSHLYPKTVSPQEIWNYLTNQADIGIYGSYMRFWRKELLSKSSHSNVADLLDSLASDVSKLNRLVDLYDFRDFSITLLDRGLRLHGDRIDRACVYRWLAIGAGAYDEFGSSDSPPTAYLAIRSWLENRPRIQMYVVETGLQFCHDDEMYSCMVNIDRRLFGAKLPEDFGLWCLKHAVRIVQSRPAMAKHLLQRAYSAYKIGPYREGLSEQVLRNHVKKSNDLSELLDSLLSPPPALSHEKAWSQKQFEVDARRRVQRQKWISCIRAAKHQLVANQADPQLLHSLALVYFGNSPYGDEELRGEHAILAAIGDADVSDAAIEGLRLTVKRNDIPTVREIIRLDKRQHDHYLCLPLLAAIEEQRSQALRSFLEPSDSALRVGVACLHSWRAEFMSDDETPADWYRQVCKSKPELVADVAVHCATSALRNDQFESRWLWDILEGGVPDNIAVQATLRLLTSFPTRCDWSRLRTLDRLLWTAVRYRAEKDLVALSLRKMSVVRMNIGQQIRWVGAGFVCGSRELRDRLATLVVGKERRARHLAQFLVTGCDPFDLRESAWRFPYEALDSASLEVVIRCLGAYCSHSGTKWAGLAISERFQVSEFIAGVIDILARQPDKSATAVLDSLHKDSNLAHWHGELTVARDAQRAVRREVEYCYPTLVQVCNALRGGEPASPADLHALAVDILMQFARQVRTSNANEWKQYWNSDSFGRPDAPRPENLCRDALLSDIRSVLPDNVTADPEQRYVNESRADISISTPEFRIPIEIKRDSNRDLWSSLRNQLIEKYTVNPASGGYGIYLVFWFGNRSKVRRNTEGVCPDSPSMLQRMLEESVSENEARRISICVIDVSSPMASGG